MHLKRGGFSPPTGSSVQEILVLRVSPLSLFPLAQTGAYQAITLICSP